MLLIISPSKTQDFNCRQYGEYTLPRVLEQSQQLIDRLREMNAGEIGALMKISEKLSTLNHQRFRDFHKPFTPENARQALLAFKGDVYKGIDSDNYTAEDFAFAQNHLRILSGLYGPLRPLDLIQPYRLEMSTKLSTSYGKNLYTFWNTRVTDILNHDFKGDADPVLLNLASGEYFKVIKSKHLKARIVTPSFKDNKNGVYKVISIYAKRARGMMTDFIIKNRITDVNEVKQFTGEGYCFNSDLSTEQQWVFCRDKV